MEPSILEDLSIDCVIFGFDKELKLLLVRHSDGISKGKWALPGGFVQKNESIDDAAERILYRLTGIKEIYLEQTKAFGSVDRFPTKRVVTIAYQALLNVQNFTLNPGFTADGAEWFNYNEIPPLPYDHADIVKYTKEQLRNKVKQEPVGFNMLPPKFTLFQLQLLYESMLDIKLDKPNFRRKIDKMNLLIDTGEVEKNATYRAAKLYRFDEQIYYRLKEKKFVLDL
ncbi:MAG: NUDIX hydrolase [Ekhidna sp.]|nr:NUDIX hydrolase [Ekhidna sp.]